MPNTHSGTHSDVPLRSTCLMVLSFDYVVTKRQSFENVEKWIQINEKANPPLKLLVGNKVDLYSTSKNTVSKADATTLAKKYGIDYF